MTDLPAPSAPRLAVLGPRARIVLPTRRRSGARDSAATALRDRERVLRAAQSWSLMPEAERRSMKRYAAWREAGSTAKSVLLKLGGLDDTFDIGDGFADRSD